MLSEQLNVLRGAGEGAPTEPFSRHRASPNGNRDGNGRARGQKPL
jgi:hypothetical protein